MLNDLWTRLVAWTGAIVAPDWEALVALIPVLLLLAVAAFVVITATKWTTAGPTRRGPGRRRPVARDGSPVRGPSAAPLAVAGGVFLLVFGLVSGSAVLGLGVAATAAALAWWAWDLRRPVGGSASDAARTGGARDVTPPARADEAAGAAGVGGTGTPAAGDRSSPGRGRVTPLRVGVGGAAVLGIAVLVATARVVPDTPATPSLSTIPPGAPSPSAIAPGSPGPSLAAADASLTAQNFAFVETTLTAPADRPFTVAFDNLDVAPHNLEIRDAGGTVLFRGDIVVGPIVTVYAVPALPAGTYPFICTVHPAMTGTLTVK
jgi:plastocyanin